MSENPSFCKIYGNCIILSRVLRPIYHGYGRIVWKDWCKIFVVPDARQILPYCVIELQNQNVSPQLGISNNLLQNSRIKNSCKLSKPDAPQETFQLHDRSGDQSATATKLPPEDGDTVLYELETTEALKLLKISRGVTQQEEALIVGFIAGLRFDQTDVNNIL